MEAEGVSVSTRISGPQRTVQLNPLFSNIVSLAEMLHQQADVSLVSFGCKKENGLLNQTIIFLKKELILTLTAKVLLL